MDKQLSAEELAMLTEWVESSPERGIDHHSALDVLATIEADRARIAELTAERDAWELEAGQHEATVAARDVGIDRLHRCCDHHKVECNNLAAIIRDKDAMLARARARIAKLEAALRNVVNWAINEEQISECGETPWFLMYAPG